MGMNEVSHSCPAFLCHSHVCSYGLCDLHGRHGRCHNHSQIYVLCHDEDFEELSVSFFLCPDVNPVSGVLGLVLGPGPGLCLAPKLELELLSCVLYCRM